MSVQEPILTISVAAKLLDLHPRTLMLYEKSGIIQPHRTDTQRRLFSLDDLNRLQFVKHMTQKEGINLQGVKTVLKAIDLASQEGFDLKKKLFPKYSSDKLV